MNQQEYSIELAKKGNAMQAELNKQINNINIYSREGNDFNDFISDKIDWLVETKDIFILDALTWVTVNMYNLAKDFKMDKIRNKKGK